MTTHDEKQEIVKMFHAYCRRTLRNARADLLREKARTARKERLFSDMQKSELNRLAMPEDAALSEIVFDVHGNQIGVADDDIAAALFALEADDRDIILLYYYAEWTDQKIADYMGLPRSTVQFHRHRALHMMKEALVGEEDGRDYL